MIPYAGAEKRDRDRAREMDMAHKGALAREHTFRDAVVPITLPRVRFLEKDGRPGEGVSYPLERA